MSTEEPKPKHPGGRPPIPPCERVDVAFNVRLSAAQRDKVKRLGGAAWVRDRIDKAKDPA